MSYIFSKVFVLGVIALVQCLLTIGTLTLFGQLESHFLLTLLIMFLTAMNGVLLGLLVSAVVRSTEPAITFGVVALFLQAEYRRSGRLFVQNVLKMKNR